MKIETGKPKIEGRYVAFIRCQSAQVRDWVEPVIMLWHKEKWASSFMPQANVVGWSGPIPVMKVSDIVVPQDYDL